MQPLTIVNYKTVIESHIKPSIGHYSLDKLKPIHIQKMISDAVENGLSSSVVKKMKVFTNAILEVAIDNKLLYSNPCRKIKLPPMPKRKKEREAFAPEEEKKIIAYAPKYAKLRTKNKLYITGWAIIILLKQGLRIEELLALTWNDIDLEKNTLHVWQAVSLKDGKAYIKSYPKTEKSIRILPLHKSSMKALEAVKEINPDGLIFCNANGGIWAERSFQHAYKNYFASLNASLKENEKVKYRSPHCCRHTFATDLNRKGVDVKTIAMLMGHAEVDLSLNVYTHTDKKTMENAISRI